MSTFLDEINKLIACKRENKVEGYVPHEHLPAMLQMPNEITYYPQIMAVIQKITTIHELSIYMKVILAKDEELNNIETDNVEDLALLKAISEQERFEFEHEVLPVMVKLAMNNEQIITKPINCLYKGREKLELTRKQCACLLSLCLFALYSINIPQDQKELPRTVKFAYTFSLKGRSRMFKLRCYINYFKNINKYYDNEIMNEVVTFKRRIGDEIKLDDVLNSQVEFKSGEIAGSKDSIMQFNGCLKADFANKRIGGGVLNQGCVQEEIMFVECPELLVSILLLPVMEVTDSCRIYNVIRFSLSKGYASHTEFDRDNGITEFVSLSLYSLTNYIENMI